MGASRKLIAAELSEEVYYLVHDLRFIGRDCAIKFALADNELSAVLVEKRGANRAALPRLEILRKRGYPRVARQ